MTLNLNQPPPPPPPTPAPSFDRHGMQHGFLRRVDPQGDGATAAAPRLPAGAGALTLAGGRWVGVL